MIRPGNLFRKAYKSFENWRNYANSRKKAYKLRKEIVDRKGSSFVDQKLIKQIKEYADSEFGSPAYWPWLALYSEMRGEFIEGWIPDDYYRLELIQKFNPRPIALLSSIKTYDYRLFDGFSVKPIGMKISGHYFDHNFKLLNASEFLNLLKSAGIEMIVKIDEGPSGSGHLFVKPENVDLSVFKKISSCVVQPVLKQHKNLNELYDKSINTLRITTLLKSDGTISHLYTNLRFGKGGNRLDNICAGGNFLYIDMEGNVASPALDSYGFEVGKNHPDTGFEFKNLKVPSVSEAVNKCKEHHLKFPYVKLIAWDVYINENREPGILEWNARSPDIWYNEALIGPLFLEESNC